MRPVKDNFFKNADGWIRNADISCLPSVPQLPTTQVARYCQRHYGPYNVEVTFIRTKIILGGTSGTSESIFESTKSSYCCYCRCGCDEQKTTRTLFHLVCVGIHNFCGMCRLALKWTGESGVVELGVCWQSKRLGLYFVFHFISMLIFDCPFRSRFIDQSRQAGRQVEPRARGWKH